MAERAHTPDDEASPPPDAASSGSSPAVPVVGIGASAGGLAAAESFLCGLPEDTGLAFVLVPHLAPDHESEMAELLRNHRGPPVAQIDDGGRVEPDHVYTIPPGRSPSMTGCCACRGRPVVTSTFRPPTTPSSALSPPIRDALACVILSGTGIGGLPHARGEADRR